MKIIWKSVIVLAAVFLVCAGGFGKSAQAEETVGLPDDSAVYEEIVNPAIPEIKENVTHIACVGDSITFGYGVWITEWSKEHSYPACLERLLGDGYQTLNYGVSGKTLLKEGDEPYISHYMYEESLKADAEIYIIMLGSNDSNPHNWDSEDFASELKAFVQIYIDLDSKPSVFLAVPPKVFEEGEAAFGVRDETIENEIAPIIRETGEKLGVPVIDLYGKTKDHPEWFMDGAHPNADGNGELAKIFASCITEEE